MVIRQSERTQFLSVNIIYKRTIAIHFIILQNCLTNVSFQSSFPLEQKKEGISWKFVLIKHETATMQRLLSVSEWLRSIFISYTITMLYRYFKTAWCLAVLKDKQLNYKGQAVSIYLNKTSNLCCCNNVSHLFVIYFLNSTHTMISFFHVGHLCWQISYPLYNFFLIAGVSSYHVRYIEKSSIRWPATERLPIFENPKAVLYMSSTLTFLTFSCP